MNHVKAVLDTLCKHYARPDGTPHVLNETQGAFYVSLLDKFSHEVLAAAAIRWMETSRFFPAISDLIGLIEPTIDPKTQANVAWSELEATARRFSNSYRSVQFDDPVLGECVKRVFGSWSRLVLMDTNDPMWASRKNLFLSIYPALMASPPHGDVVILPGHDGGRDIQGVVRCTRPGALPGPDPDRSRIVLSEIKRRFRLIDGGNREAS